MASVRDSHSSSKKNKKRKADEEDQDQEDQNDESDEDNHTPRKKKKCDQRQEKMDPAEWPAADLKELFVRMESVLPRVDMVKYTKRLERMDWDAVKFADYSGAECASVFQAMMKKVRMYQNLGEMVSNMRSIYNRQPRLLQGRQGPKKPVSSFFLFSKDKKEKIQRKNPDMSATEISRLLGEKYNKLSPRKKLKYVNLYNTNMETYREELQKFQEEHPDLTALPEKAPKISTPASLFATMRSQKMLEEDPDLTQKTAYAKAMRKWKNLREKKKTKWIKKAFEKFKDEYLPQCEEYRLTHPDFVAKTTCLTKKEQLQKDLSEGMPEKVPQSGFHLFTKGRYTERQEGESLMGVSTRLIEEWKSLTGEEQKEYNEQVKEAKKTYNIEYARYLESLPEERRQELMAKKPHTTPAPSANGDVSDDEDGNESSEDSTNKRHFTALNSKTPEPLRSALSFYIEEQTRELVGSDKDFDLKTTLTTQFKQLTEKEKDKYRKMADKQRKQTLMSTFVTGVSPANKPKLIEKANGSNKPLPGEPKKPPTSGYSVFSQKMLKELTDIPNNQRMATIGQKWRELSPEKKQKFNKKAKKGLEQYAEEVETFKQMVAEARGLPVSEVKLPSKKGKNSGKPENASKGSGSKDGKPENANKESGSKDGKPENASKGSGSKDGKPENASKGSGSKDGKPENTSKGSGSKDGSVRHKKSRKDKGECQMTDELDNREDSVRKSHKDSMEAGQIQEDVISSVVNIEENDERRPQEKVDIESNSGNDVELNSEADLVSEDPISSQVDCSNTPLNPSPEHTVDRKTKVTSSSRESSPKNNNNSKYKADSTSDERPQVTSDCSQPRDTFSVSFDKELQVPLVRIDDEVTTSKCRVKGCVFECSHVYLDSASDEPNTSVTDDLQRNESEPTQDSIEDTQPPTFKVEDYFASTDSVNESDLASSQVCQDDIKPNITTMSGSDDLFPSGSSSDRSFMSPFRSLSSLSKSELNLPPSIIDQCLDVYKKIRKGDPASVSARILSQLCVSAEEAQAVEHITHGQSWCDAWYFHRRGRITASAFADVAYVSSTRKKTLVKKILADVRYPVTTWGLEHEKTALSQYRELVVKHHDKLILADSGFVINPAFPHIGASPDSWVMCDCCGLGVVEVKCPVFLPAFKSPSKPKTKCSFSFLNPHNKHTPLCPPSLPQGHNYYYQVQGQMAVCDVQYCDFVCWTPNEIHVERITRDMNFFGNLKNELDAFYLCDVIPAILVMEGNSA